VCDHLRPMIAWCDPKPRQPGCTLYVFADTISVLRATAPTRRVGIDTRTPAARLRIVNRAGACVANIVLQTPRAGSHASPHSVQVLSRHGRSTPIRTVSREPRVPLGRPEGAGKIAEARMRGLRRVQEITRLYLQHPIACSAWSSLA
jgi:hypothetical protein